MSEVPLQAEDREMGNGVVILSGTPPDQPWVYHPRLIRTSEKPRLLSGDRHIGAVYKGVQSDAASVPYPVWEVRPTPTVFNNIVFSTSLT